MILMKSFTLIKLIIQNLMIITYLEKAELQKRFDLV